MCCSTRIAPIPPDWRLMLGLAGFQQTEDTFTERWQRIEGEGSIQAAYTAAGPNIEEFLTFSLRPAIASHSQELHDVNGARAAILFETVRALAEKSAGTILQLSLVGKCAIEAGGNQLTLAVYPDKPLLWEHLCLGFRQTLSRGIPQEAP